jgi:hypothetical protein
MDSRIEYRPNHPAILNAGTMRVYGRNQANSADDLPKMIQAIKLC